jgi:hypothetical protein
MHLLPNQFHFVKLLEPYANPDRNKTILYGGGFAITFGYFIFAFYYLHWSLSLTQQLLFALFYAFIITLHYYVYYYMKEDRFKYEWVEQFFFPFRKNKDNKRIISIYEFKKKIIFIFIAILIALTVIDYSFPMYTSNYFYYGLIGSSQVVRHPAETFQVCSNFP